MTKLILTKDQNQELRNKVSAFTKFDNQISSQVAALEQLASLDEIKTSEQRQVLYNAVKDASKVRRDYGVVRKDATRPIDDLKKQVINHEKEVAADLDSLILKLKGLIQKFDAEQERIRLAELAKIEEERKAREEAERKERERKYNAREYIAQYRQSKLNWINSCDSSGKVADAVFLFDNVDAQELFPDLISEGMQELSNARTARYNHLKQVEELEAQRKAAEAEQSAAKAAMIAEQQKAAEEAAKLEAERQKIEAEKRQIAEEKARLEAEAKRRKEQEEARKAEQARIKELEASRARGISSGIENVEVTDLSLVPTDLYEVKFNLPKLKAALKKGKVPGVKVTFKNSLVLV